MQQWQRANYDFFFFLSMSSDIVADRQDTCLTKKYRLYLSLSSRNISEGISSDPIRDKKQMSGNTVTRLAEEKQTRPHFKELGGTLLKITPAINHGISKSLFHDMKGIFQSYVSWGSALPQPRLQP